MDIIHSDKRIEIRGVSHFDAAASCMCGQAFRWKNTDRGIFGVVGDKPMLLKQNGQSLILEPCDEADIGFWINYFDLGRNYESIERLIADDDILSVCVPYSLGIRVFNQPPFEALISFIISANNNIKRISGIIERLCVLAGEYREGVYPYYAFPTPEAVSALTEEQLTSIGTGYRAPFIKKSAQIIADGYDLEKLRSIPLDEARRELLKFPGVGPKVADCVLLFSLGHTDAFPIDVWMGRAMKELYFDRQEPTKKEMEEKVKSLGQYSGIIQQYIFHYARNVQIGKKQPV